MTTRDHDVKSEGTANPHKGIARSVPRYHVRDGSRRYDAAELDHVLACKGIAHGAEAIGEQLTLQWNETHRGWVYVARGPVKCGEPKSNRVAKVG